MPRPRQRACLQDGLKLDINKLARQQLFIAGTSFWHHTIHWTDSYTGELTASGVITTHLQNERAGWLRIEIGKLDQWIDLVSQPRHFGGRQWYFRCPCTPRCSVLWMPPGANRFTSRQNWGRQAAYASQFETPLDRAHRGKAKITARLIGISDPAWDFPPKPKWMRWRTYNRLEQRFDAYENLLDQIAAARVLRLISKS